MKLVTRFPLQSLLLVVTAAAVGGGLLYILRHFDDPVIVVVVSDDATIVLTQDMALELSAAALRQAGLEPVRPEAAYGNDDDPDRFIGRNALGPEDRVSVIWYARGGSYPTYTVTLERGESSIIASIGENWL